MNKRVIDWDNYEENFCKRWAERDLEESKSGSIAFIKDIGGLTSWEIYYAHWEDWLSSSDYFKNWQEKINSFQTEKEVNFYTSRLQAIMEFVKEHTRKDIRFVEGAKPWDPINTPKLIEQELKRLENISEEEFNKTDKWRKSVEFKELSVEEMKNDPWFSKQLGFDSENKKDEERKEKENSPIIVNNNTDYKSWTKEQLITEINRLKVEIEELKRNQTLTSSEKESKLRQNQKKLEQLNSYYSAGSQSNLQPNNSNDKFLTGWVIGGVFLLGIILTVLIITTNKNKKKPKV